MTEIKSKKKSTKKEYPIIKSRKNQFDAQRNKLKIFSKQLPENKELPVYPESGGLFGLFKSNVKATDLNELTDKIQDKMIDQNKLMVKIVKEFHTIYDTFSALDKEYIQGILSSLLAAEEANKKALEGIKGVRANQENIEGIINQQSQVITLLKNFKTEIDQIKHIHDIDELYATFTPIPNNIKVIESNIETQQSSIDYFKKGTELLQDKLRSLTKTVDKKYETVEHLILNVKLEIKKTILENKQEFEANQAFLGNEIELLSKVSQKKFKIINEQIKRIEFNHAKSINDLINTINHQKNDMHTFVEKELEIVQREAKQYESLVKQSIINVKIEIEKVIDENKQAFEINQMSLGKEIGQLSEDSHKNLKTVNDQIKEIDSNRVESMEDLKARINNRINDMYTFVEEEQVIIRREADKHNELIGSVSKSLKISKFISYISVIVLFILVALIISGVL